MGKNSKTSRGHREERGVAGKRNGSRGGQAGTQANGRNKKVSNSPGLRNGSWNGSRLSPQSRGLVNSGNTCYINSILQPLMLCRPLVDGVLEGLMIYKDSVRYPLLSSFVDLIDKFGGSNREHGMRPYEPKSLFRAMNNTSFRRIGQPQDAEEFFNHLLDGFEKEMEDAKGGSKKLLGGIEKTLKMENSKGEDVDIKYIDTADTLISQVFYGKQLVEVEDLDNNTTSLMVEPFRVVHLNILDGSIVSIGDAVGNYLAKEMIAINGKKGLMRKTAFISFPSILVLHLRRITLDSGRITKLNKPIKYDNNISVPVHKSDPVHFRLMGIVFHLGQSWDDGHYTCGVMAPTGNWHYFDDENSHEVDLAYLRSDKRARQAYLLFYEKV